jgi:hypothetical protein
MRAIVKFRVLNWGSIGRFAGGLVELRLGEVNFRLLQVIEAKRDHAVQLVSAHHIGSHMGLCGPMLNSPHDDKTGGCRAEAEPRCYSA